MGRLGKSQRPAALLWLALLLLAAHAVWARPGGGSSFSSGSSGSSGGGGGDGSELEALFYLIQFAINYPYLGLPLLAIIAYCYYVNSGRSPAEEIVSSNPGRGALTQRGVLIRQQVR